MVGIGVKKENGNEIFKSIYFTFILYLGPIWKHFSVYLGLSIATSAYEAYWSCLDEALS